MKNIDFNKHIWEGWKVKDFIVDLEPLVETIQRGESWNKPFKTKSEVKQWCIDNQPGYKKHIPEVVDYFCKKYNIKG